MNSSPRLTHQEFKTAVGLLPLVSIDLLVRNARGELLVGMRKNPPAAGFWFVPGGRIRKGEKLPEAFRRLVKTELGIEFELEDARLKGLFDHIYEDDFTGASEGGTHYVVLAHAFRADLATGELPAAEHSSYRWLDDESIARDPKVHPNTKAYARDTQR